MSPRALLGLLALGCSPTPIADDAALYRHALAAPPADALKLCARLTNASLAGDCGTEAAVRAADAGDEAVALAACKGLPAGQWADECLFQVVDALLIQGPRAWSLCTDAGRYRDFCVGHAINRTLEDLGPADVPLEVGQEKQLVRALREYVKQLDVQLPAGHQQTVVFTAAARHIAARWTDAPFDPATCGNASDELCRRAYADSMPQGTVDRGTVCSQPLASNTVDAAGGTPWVEGADEVVKPVWEALCVASGERKGSANDLTGPRAPQDRGPRGNGPPPDGPQGEGPRGKGPRGKGPRGKGPRGKGPRGKGPHGEGPHGEGPAEHDGPHHGGSSEDTPPPQ